MAYPFTPSVKVGDFVKRLVETEGCREGQFDGIRYIERKEADGRRRRVPIDLPNEEMIIPSIAVDWIHNLGLKASDFGYDLD